MIEPLEYRIAPATLTFAAQLANQKQASNLIATDAQGNILVAGVFDVNFDVDPSSTVNNLTTTDSANGDVYIAKYTPAGALIWAQKWGGTGRESPAAIVAAANGDVFVTGSFLSSNAGFGGSGNLSTTGIADVFVLKMSGLDGSPVAAFDTDGQLKFGGTSSDSGTNIALDGNGHVLVGGAFSSTDAGFNGTGVFSSGAGGGVQSGFVFRVDATSGAVDSTFGAAPGGLIGPGTFPAPSIVQHVLVDQNNDVFVGIITLNAPSHGIFKFQGSNGAGSATFTTININVATVNDGNFGMTLDAAGRVITSNVGSVNIEIHAYDGATGTPDAAFPNGGTAQISFIPAVLNSMTLVTDSHSNIFMAGVGSGIDYLVGLDRNGNFTTSYSWGKTHDPTLVTAELGMAIDASDNLVFRGTYATGADLDPSFGGTLKLAPRKDVVASLNMVEGFITKIDPFGFDQKNPFFYNDANGKPILVSLTGAGHGHAELVGGFLSSRNLDSIELFDTDLSTKLLIDHFDKPTTDTTVGRIFTHDLNQSVGSITLDPFVLLGDSVDDNLPDLHVSGKLNSLAIDGLNAHAYIKLGDGLPYNVANEDKTPDTYNNRPDLTVGAVLGPDVIIEVTGDGTVAGVGGGGLGKVTFGSWGFTGGVIRTTQSIGDFTIQHGNFDGILEIDKDHLGAATQANVGRMTIQNGSWGGSGTEIEGDVKAFDADAFLAGATLTAANIGKVVVGGDFEGTVTLTDPDTLPSFSVNSDFTGTVISSGNIKALKIKGDFRGSLQALSIGSISAYQFIGTSIMGVPTTYIKATAGAIGTITSTAGPVTDFAIDTDLAFKGIKVNLSKLTQNTIGIDNVHIKAKSIGNLSVSLKAAANAAGINLIGIRDSDFITTATGTTKTTAGSIGTVSVTIAGGPNAASATGIVTSTFDSRVLADEFVMSTPASTVNALGNITVKISGSGGSSVGILQSTFEGDTVGAVKVTTTPKDIATNFSRDVDTASFTATRSIGALSFDGDASVAQVTGLNVWAGDSVGNVTIKSKTAANGTLDNSAILAGQSLVLDGATDKAQLALLKAAGLGAVSVSGSITNSKLVAGASIGAVSAGLDITGSLVLAGARLGGDFVLDGDEIYQRAAAIASLTAKGLFASSSVVAGVNPGADYTFGGVDDSTADPVNLLSTGSSIGTITLGAGSGIVSGATGVHNFAIQAAAIKSLNVGTSAVFNWPYFLDQGTPGEDSSDVIVRLL